MLEGAKSMTFSTFSKRLAATGAASALAAGALVGATSTSAIAAPISNSYTCSNEGLGLGPWTVGLESDAPGIEGFPEIGAGFDVPPTLLTLENTFTIPESAHTTLTGSGVEDISFPDFAGKFGASSIPVNGMTAKVSEMADNGNGTYSFDSNGENGAFEVPRAGTHQVLSPAAFQMSASVPGIGNVPVNCTLAEGTSAGSYATIESVKNKSATAAKATKKAFKKGTAVKIRVVVTDKVDYQAPEGKVQAKKGSAKPFTAKLNSEGVAVINLGKKLKPGKHKFTVSFGSGYYETSTDKVVVKVVR
jgi:hypothetical protein